MWTVSEGSFIRPITDHMIEQKYMIGQKFVRSILLIKQNFHFTFFQDILA